MKKNYGNTLTPQPSAPVSPADFPSDSPPTHQTPLPRPSSNSHCGTSRTPVHRCGSRNAVRLCTEHLVLDVVALGVVVDDQAFVVLRALVHHLTEDFKRGEHPRVALVDALPVGHDVFTQDEHVVDVGT